MLFLIQNMLLLDIIIFFVMKSNDQFFFAYKSLLILKPRFRKQDNSLQ